MHRTEVKEHTPLGGLTVVYNLLFSVHSSDLIPSSLSSPG